MSFVDLHSPAALLPPPPKAQVGGPDSMAAVPLTVNLLPGNLLKDKFGRTITDLRVSITDRCNYKCVYCRTGSEGAQFAELAMDDYLRMIRVFVSLGIQKVRLTGGEPLLRMDIISLVTQLAELRTNSSQSPLD